jgi:hypothetical protein
LDPRQLIRHAAQNEEYFVTDHCLQEMDKDGLSLAQIESVMLTGGIRKRDPRRGRYTLVDSGIMICVEIARSSKQIAVITAGRERR